MTHQEFKNRIHALAVELGANIEIETRGETITRAVVNVGRWASLFVTFNSYFNKIETCDTDGEEETIDEKSIEKVIAFHYLNALAKHLENVAEFISDELAK